MQTDREQTRGLKSFGVVDVSRSMQNQMDGLLARVGEPVAEPFTGGFVGVPTNSFRKASSLVAAPVGAFGRFRVGGDSRTLNRVINLQIGSPVAEAALKMMLARFYRADAVAESPQYEGLITSAVAVEFLVARMDKALGELASAER